MLNGLDILILAVVVIAGCGVAYYWGKKDGRAEMLAERLEDLLGQERRHDEISASKARKCSICGEDLQYDDGRYWHTATNPIARGRHAPVPAPIDP